MSEIELGCKWHFDYRGGQDQGPNDAKSITFRKDSTAALVRESIQNSLDAVYDVTQPVEVVFRFRKMTKAYSEFFNLGEHIRGCLDMYPTQDAHLRFDPMLEYLDDAKRNGMMCLEVADYNTKGMDYKKGDTGSPFYSFVRCAGNSSKDNSNAGGSFGLGKAAYFNASQLSSLIISTKTAAGQCFFEGVTSLCTHKIGNEYFQAVGFYDNNDGEPSKDVPAKFKREAAGTSVYIVGVDDEIVHDLRDAVMLHFWLSILKGKLSVKCFRGEGELFTLTKDNIIEKVEERFADQEHGKRGYNNPWPYLDAVANAEIDKKHIHITENLPILGKCDFYVYKQKEAKDRILYMRKPCMLVFDKTNGTNYGFYGVFLCSDPRGNEILRSTENPAHNEWDYKNCVSDKRKAKDAIKELYGFIDQTLKDIFTSKSSTFIDIKGLEEFLYIPTEYNDDDDEYEQEAATGESTNKTQDEGTSPIGSITEPVQKPATKPFGTPAVGHVMEGTPRKATPKEEGDLYTGHGDRPKKTLGGGAPGAFDPKNSYVNDEDGTPGSYAGIVNSKYRAFAQCEDGRVVHNLILYPDMEVKKGRIELTVAGEESDMLIDIESAEGYAVHNNCITGVQLSHGRNCLKVIFKDNMRYALKLKVYETK